jgi:exodeoxyribonuclease VII small subunit
MAPAAKNSAATEKSPESFEAAMAELDRLVEKMENGQLPLAESLSAYQRGTELLKYCESVLKDAEQKIKVLDDGALKDYEK